MPVEEVFRGDVVDYALKISWLLLTTKEDENGIIFVENLDEYLYAVKFAENFPEGEENEFLDVDGLLTKSSKPGMNTYFEYMYRDGANYKKSEVIILPGVIQPDQLATISNNLFTEFDPDDFLPAQIGLKRLCPMRDDDRYDDDIDHALHTISLITLTAQEPTLNVSIDDFVNRFAEVGPDGWNLEEFGN